MACVRGAKPARQIRSAFIGGNNGEERETIAQRRAWAYERMLYPELPPEQNSDGLCRTAHRVDRRNRAEALIAAG